MTKIKIKKSLGYTRSKTANINKIIFYSNLFLTLSIISFVFVHFIQFTGAASEGFVLGKLSSELTELKSENKDLNLKSAELQSIDKIKLKSEKDLGMVASAGFDYIKLEASSLSLK
ncbi:MAG: hypothetical protein PHH83_01145 [Patescibacteria group bacterium]|nr:hypothetical protein [Patescibacteria group bacterium]